MGRRSGRSRTRRVIWSMQIGHFRAQLLTDHATAASPLAARARGLTRTRAREHAAPTPLEDPQPRGDADHNGEVRLSVRRDIGESVKPSRTAILNMWIFWPILGNMLGS